jgi:uncharacterized protein YndB with AHSA1/START domain
LPRVDGGQWAIRAGASGPEFLTAGMSDQPAAIRLHSRSMPPQARKKMEMNMAKKRLSEQAPSAANTVRLHRVFAAAPEKLYRAFTDADAIAKWLPPSGFIGKVHHSDAKVGGSYKMSFTNFTTGNSHTFGGEYLELVPGERIRYTDKFDDPNLPGEMMTTVTLKKVSVGTEVHIEQSGLPAAIPVEACYLGWQQSLMQLAMVVEPDIQD